MTPRSRAQGAAKLDTVAMRALRVTGVRAAARGVV